MPQNTKVRRDTSRRIDTAHRRRINKLIAEAGLVTGYTPNVHWSTVRQQFQALYRKLGGDFDEMMRIGPKLIRMPPGQSMPPDHVFQEWIWEYEIGIADIPPKIAQIVHDKVTNSRMNFLWKTLHTGGEAYAALSERAAAGTLPAPIQSQLLSAANGFNYSMGSLAQMEKIINGNQGPTLQLRGSLSLDTGPPPKRLSRKAVKKLKEIPTEAEWRELDDSD